jgi:hypothetical protein
MIDSNLGDHERRIINADFAVLDGERHPAILFGE